MSWKNKIIDKITWNLPGNYVLLYATVMGSHLYGTNSKNSDLDVKFIFLPSVDDCILGIEKTNLSYNSSNDSTKNSKDDVDIQGWSLQYFIQLLKKGDTNAIDVLYSMSNTDAIIFYNPVLADLFNNKNKFYTRANLRGLLGYIVTQSERYGLKGKNFKCFERILKIINVFKEEIKPDPIDFYTVSYIVNKISEEIQDEPTLFKLEKTEDNRESIRVCGKVHHLSISIVEFEKRILSEYLKYGERTKMSLNGSDWKALSHACRAIFQAIELLDTGKIVFPLKDADFIKMVKDGKLSRNELDEVISNGLQEVNKKLRNVNDDDVVDIKYTQNFILYVYSILGT